MNTKINHARHNSQAVSLAAPEFNDAPTWLRGYRQWVCIREEVKCGISTITPICPRDGSKASLTNAAAWSSFENALKYYKAHAGNGVDGIGFVVTEDDEYCLVKVKNCIDAAAGNISDVAQRIVEKLDSYTEESPNGRDVHIIIKARLINGGALSEPNLECYDKNNFIPLSGRVLGSRSEVKERQAELESVLQENFQSDTTSPPSVQKIEEVVRQEPIQTKDAACEDIKDISETATKTPCMPAGAAGKTDNDNSNNILAPTHCPPGDSLPKIITSDDWEPDLKDWPVLSQAALPGVVGEFVTLATRNSEADPAAVLATLLVRFGVEVYGMEAGRGPKMLVGETVHYPRLFAAIVGNSSKARKGTSSSPVARLFTTPDDVVLPFENSSYERAPSSSGPLSTGEGLIFAVRDERKEWVIDKKTRAGEWQIADPGVKDKRLFVCEEEFAAALQCSRRDGNTLSTTLRCFWDSGTVAPLTKSNQTKVTGGHVGIVTHITLQELTKLLNAVELFNGFANRFLWVCARRQKIVALPLPMPTAEFELIQTEVIKLVSNAQAVDYMSLTSKAQESWKDVYQDISQDHPGLAGAAINRAEAQVLRLAMIYALLTGQDAIDVPALQAALAFWKYCKESALFIFGIREANPSELKIIMALQEGPKTATQLYKASNNKLTKEQMTYALQNLLASGQIFAKKKIASKRMVNFYSLSE